MKDRKNIIMIIAIAIAIILFLFFNTTVFATTGTITASDLRLRKENNTNSSILAMLDENEKVEILDEDGDWYKVKAQGKVGYVGKKYVKTNVAENNNNNNNNTSSENTNTTIKNEEIKNNTTENIVTSENNNAQPSVSNNAVNSSSNNATTKRNGTLSVDTDIRIIPLITEDVISIAKKNENVIVLSNVGTWSYITNDSKSGWVLTSAINIEGETNKNQVPQEPVPTPSTTETKQENPKKEEETKKEEEKKQEESTTEKMYESSKTYYVKGTSVNARSKPNKNSESVDQLNTNEEVKVIGEDGDWYIVKLNGKKVYIAKTLLSSKKVEVTSRNTNVVSKPEEEKQQQQQPVQTSNNTGLSGDSVVAYAKGFLGYRYVYGTNGPNTFDCSGFVQYVYKHFGISLSRSSKTQANDGVFVSKNNLQPGDILIFKNTSKTEIGHVGIYIGNGQFIHASSSKTGVIISSLSSASYQQRYVSARRVI